MKNKHSAYLYIEKGKSQSHAGDFRFGDELEVVQGRHGIVQADIEAVVHGLVLSQRVKVHIKIASVEENILENGVSMKQFKEFQWRTASSTGSAPATSRVPV